MTIRQKLTLYWAAVLSAILLVAASAIFLIFSREQWRALDAALMEEADTSAGAIARGDQSAAVAVARRLSQERDLGPGKRVRLLDGNTVVTDFGGPGADSPPTPDAGLHRGIFDGQRNLYRFAVMPLSIGTRTGWLEDGVDASAVRAAIARLRAILLFVTPVLLLVCVAGGYWLAGRSLAPISLLADELARIDPKAMSRRLPVGIARDEIARLAGSINALLDRVETASAAERRFLSDAAHELRTPLTVLRTGLEVALNRERQPQELRAALDSALREAVALCTTADDLLALARLGEETFEQSTAVDLGAVVREVADAVEPLLQSKHLLLNRNGLGTLPVRGNRDHLRRVAINLLDNAIKFTPQGGRIAVSLERNDSRALLRVRDSGPGIAPADLPLIFERFFRGAAQTAGGSGLGLSLCKEIVRLHKGEITARNNSEGGCEFVVSLPLEESGSAI